MQSPVICAFRKRLSNAGYTHISIKLDRSKKYKLPYKVYIVSAVEPLGCSLIHAEYTIELMYNSFR